MTKLLGATSALVVAALGVAIASLVFNILIYSNQVNTSPVPAPNFAACPTPDPSTLPAAPPTPGNDARRITTESPVTSAVSDDKEIPDDQKITTPDSPDPSTDSTPPPSSDDGTETDPHNHLVPPPYTGPVSDNPAWKEAANRILATANLSVDPCDDFYQFTCGNYLQNTELEDGASRKATSDEAQYQINLGLANYFDSKKLRDLNSKTEQYQKIFLDICVADGKSTTDSAGRKAKWADLSKDLDKYLGFPLFGKDAVNKNRDEIFTAMGKMERQFTGGPLFTSIVTSDYKDSKKNALYINQPALRFDRDIYVKPQNSDKLDEYATEIRDLLLVYGHQTGRKINHNLWCPEPDRLNDVQCAQQIAEKTVNFERSLAMASWPDTELRNYQQQYSAVYTNLVLFYYDYQSLRLDNYVRALIDMPAEDSNLNGFKVVLAQPTYFAALEGMFGVNTIQNNDLTNYLAIHFLMENAAEYGIDIPSIDEINNRKEATTKSKSARYNTRRGHGARRIRRPPLNSNGLAANDRDALRASCIDTLIDYMPFGPGFTFVKSRSDRDAMQKDMKNGMADNIIVQISYFKMLKYVDWLDEDSLRRATDKGHYYLKINYLWPEFFGDFYHFEAIDSYNQKYTSIVGDIYYLNSNELPTYWEMLKNARAGFQNTEQFGILGQAGDRSNFLMSPATAAVWYQPERNSITIPLGILTAPYYDKKYPEQYNYAVAGTFMGREFWRAVDDEGAQFGEEGMLAECSFSHCSIFDSPSQKGFDNMAECVVNQYNSQCCPMEKGRCVNGDTTKRSNLADIGGLTAAYWAFSGYASYNQERLPGLEQYSNKQILWMSYGASMCSKMTDERLRAELMIGTQAPSSCRVNQAIQDIPQFGKDFLCKYKRGDWPTNPAEGDTCEVWVNSNTESR